MKNIAIFASGTGSNAKRIIEHLTGNTEGSVALVACNKPGAGVIQISKDNNIPVLMIEKERFFRGDGYVSKLKDAGVELIVLAGFLWKVPATIIEEFRHRIVNIHPALLPKYGGKGMYGSYVHEAVIAAGEQESGITIHYVDEHYDNGDVILQAKCDVKPNDTPQSLAERIHRLEHEHYPKVVEELLQKI